MSFIYLSEAERVTFISLQMRGLMSPHSLMLLKRRHPNSERIKHAEYLRAQLTRDQVKMLRKMGGVWSSI